MERLVVKEYVAATGLSDEAAKRVGTFLESRFAERPIVAADVVEAARPPSSPIHRDFEWDDAVAGELYRREQARYLLRHIQVVFVGREERPPTHAYHNVVTVSRVRATVGSSYVPASVVWADADLAEQVEERARRELLSWTARYREYSERLAEIARGIEQLVLR